MKLRFSLLFSFPFLLLLAACGGSSDEAPDSTAEKSKEPFKIYLQTDWYAQPEHGGFYQAVVEGYYADEGLDVEIIPGGPGAMVTQKLLQGQVQFGLSRSDEVITAVSRGLPLAIAGAHFQKDPQALMFHAESGIEGFEDLDGRSVMVAPGSAYIEIIQRQFDITFSVIPLDYGMNRFLADKDFIQQCFVTNEPYYVSREGANVETLLISDGGFSPYRVWYTTKAFQRKNPEVVDAFYRASVRGWKEYVYGDRTKADELIASLNPKMDDGLMEFCHESILDRMLVTGDGEDFSQIGVIDPERIKTQIEQLNEIDMIDRILEVKEVVVPTWLESSKETSKLEWKTSEASSSDLIVKVGNPVQEYAIAYQALASLPMVDKKLTLEMENKLTPVRGIPLSTLIESLPIEGTWDYLLANCSDGYQSNYSPEVIAQNDPFLILEVEGKPIAEWVKSKGHPEWGPYMIMTLTAGDLVDPVNKNPWGVHDLAFVQEDSLLAAFTGVPDIANHAGFPLLKGNCASCHSLEDSPWGGNVSNRTFYQLSLFAKGSPAYFYSMLEDPVGTNPLAGKMPAVTHYSQEQREAVLDALLQFGAP